ncbi:hypothetical protein [Paracoccus sediminicola]|uniref:hypothetical protein n=1 Tax=Paracoccus sediminicola TaxID=3017783 RepID=UPI0022F103AB|nr:hypothetical protein [Paracoccus sediminicola]WBU56881.1 hypothetical protein PAF18_00075 [Paracoccus sediminicola]
MIVEKNTAFYARLDRSAQKLDQLLLENLLQCVRSDSGKSEFSGGIGEQQFQSYLNREYAKMLAVRFNPGQEPAKND